MQKDFYLKSTFNEMNYYSWCECVCDSKNNY